MRIQNEFLDLERKTEFDSGFRVEGKSLVYPDTIIVNPSDFKQCISKNLTAKSDTMVFRVR